MATRKGATKTVSGKRFRYNGTKWVQIKSQGNVTPTSSSNRASRSRNSTNTPTTDSGRTNRGGSSVTTNTRRSVTPKSPTKALPPGNKGGELAIRNKTKASNSSTSSTPTTRSKPSLRSRAYVNLRKAGINPDKVTNFIGKNSKIKRLGGAQAAAALTAHGLAATPGPTGRRVKKTLEKQDKDRKSVMDMSFAKGRSALEALGLVDKKTTSTSKQSNSDSNKSSGGVTAAQSAELRKKNAKRIARIKRESDAKVAAGRNDPNSPFYKTPSGGGGRGGGRNNVTPTTSTKKTGANDSRNAAYIAARKKLNSNSTKAERDKVRDMGLALSKSIHGDKGGRGSKKPKTSKTSNVGPVKDGAKYARSLAKSGVRRGAKNAAKADNRLQATESVRAGMTQGRTADKNNEKKKKQRRFSNESLRISGQRT